MSLWTRLRKRDATRSHLHFLNQVQLRLPGWNEDSSTSAFRAWWHEVGDGIVLASPGATLHLHDVSDREALQAIGRDYAERLGGGLIEASIDTGGKSPRAHIIYKTQEGTGYLFTGRLSVVYSGFPQNWTAVCGEAGTTGVREAVVAAQMLEAGTLTLDEYEERWAQDPYDSEYHGIDRSTLRFISDDESYDSLFPDHPLSRLRRILAQLADAIQYPVPRD